MGKVDNSLATESEFKRFRKNHERELVSCFSNLQRILDFLNTGRKLSSLANNPKFFRPEGKGVFRIGQTGLTNAKETRLYVYPFEEKRLVFILGIGTKETQRADIASAKASIKGISSKK
ncbi:MAG: hypothetical protein ACOYOE_02945 [Chlorobium sp.]